VKEQYVVLSRLQCLPGRYGGSHSGILALANVTSNVPKADLNAVEVTPGVRNWKPIQCSGLTVDVDSDPACPLLPGYSHPSKICSRESEHECLFDGRYVFNIGSSRSDLVGDIWVKIEHLVSLLSSFRFVIGIDVLPD